MQHKDMRDGVEYAVDLGRSRPESGAGRNVRLRIIDKRKAFTREAQYDDSHRHTGWLITEVAPGTRGAEMLAEFVTDSGKRKAGYRITVEPREVACTWDRHLGFVALREASEARRREQVQAATQRREHIDALLVSNGVQARMQGAGGASGTWTLDEAGALALVKRLATLQEDAQALVGLREDEGA